MTTKVDPLPPVLDDNLEPQGNGTWLDLAQNASRGRADDAAALRLDRGRCHRPNADTRLEHQLEVIAEAVPDAVLVVNERTEPRPQPSDADPPPARTAGPVPRSRPSMLPSSKSSSGRKRQHLRRVDPARGGPTQQDLNDPPAEDLLSLLREVDTTGGRLAVWASTPHASAPPRPARDPRPRMLVKDLSRQLPPTAADEGRRRTARWARKGRLTCGDAVH